MQRLFSIAVTIVGIVALAASPAAAAHDRGDLTVGLNGANEVGTDGDQNGSGRIPPRLLRRRRQPRGRLPR